VRRGRRFLCTCQRLFKYLLDILIRHNRRPSWGTHFWIILHRRRRGGQLHRLVNFCNLHRVGLRSRAFAGGDHGDDPLVGSGVASAFMRVSKRALRDTVTTDGEFECWSELWSNRVMQAHGTFDFWPRQVVLVAAPHASLGRAAVSKQRPCWHSLQ